MLSVNGLFSSLSLISKYSLNSSISIIVSLKDTLVSLSQLPVCYTKANVSNDLSKPKPPSINSNLYSHPYLFSIISILNALLPFMLIHPDLLFLVSCLSLILMQSYILLHFGPESISLWNAITISMIMKCSLLLNTSSTSVTISKDLSILFMFAPITRTSKLLCPRKS